MASGIEMMLKALGIDPNEIKAAMTDTIGKLQSGINSIGESLNTISENQKEINARLARLERHLGIPNEASMVPVNEAVGAPVLRIAGQ